MAAEGTDEGETTAPCTGKANYADTVESMDIVVPLAPGAGGRGSDPPGLFR